MLIPVLWIVVFLALAAASFTLSVRSHVQETTADLAVAEARGLADAGVQLALHDLLNARLVRGWQRRIPADNRAYRCALEAGSIIVTVEDEAGKVDLNAAPEPLLRRLLAGAGASDADATRLTAAIIDYRDADSDRQPSGAEAEDYQAAGRASGPKNAAFDSTLEVAQVLGMHGEIIARLRPYLTVHSGLPGLDTARASPELLALLGNNPAGGFAARLPAELRVVSPQRAFLVRAEAMGPRGAVFVREAIVRLPQSRTRLYSIVAWRQGNRTGKAASAATDIGPC